MLISMQTRTEPVLRGITIVCAIFLLLAIMMPNFLARTSWESGKRNKSTVMVDSAASYVGLVSLYGLVACVALAISAWRRLKVASTLVATAAFAGAAYVIGNFWLGLSRGIVLLDGSPVSTMGYPNWTVRWPPMLPLFALAAVIGAVSTLMLAISWLRQPEAPTP